MALLIGQAINNLATPENIQMEHDYWVNYKSGKKRNPLRCRFCGKGMELEQLYHPNRGLFFDLLSADWLCFVVVCFLLKQMQLL